MFAKLKKPMPAMICRNGTFFASMRSSSRTGGGCSCACVIEESSRVAAKVSSVNTVAITASTTVAPK